MTDKAEGVCENDQYIKFESVREKERHGFTFEYECNRNPKDNIRVNMKKQQPRYSFHSGC